MPDAAARPHQPIADLLRSWFLLLYVAVFAMIAMFWPHISAETAGAKLYMGMVTAAYAALYSLVPAALALLFALALRPAADGPRWRRNAVVLAAWLGGMLTVLCLYADYRIYGLYEFHLNGFVWNLLTTPGGIAALGATDSTMRTIALQVATLFLAGVLAMRVLQRSARLRCPRLSHRARAAFAGALLALVVSGEGVYAYSTHTGQEDYLQAAEVVPFHLHTSATGLFNRLGVRRTALTNLRIAGGEVNYPAARLQAPACAVCPNIIMLVGESFRWDLLDPEITPNLWKFAGESLRFERHYSGGNRTRMGLFSMFYGIYAPYWYSFERQRVAPALMDFVRARNYQLALHTSQSFDYPELRHTLFAGVPGQYMQELKSGEAWKRDAQNIGDIIARLDRRDPSRPFFGFMFFESTHAPYNFPDDAVIRPDYVKDLDYADMNLQQNARRIHARYVNAAHHVDREVGRLLDHLKRSGMLDNTIVMFTGDHGEEFMEKGHWGHGHDRSFPEEQIRVPLVLHLPGRAPGVITHRTSHLEIAPTLLGQLGVGEDSRNYSSAGDLFSQAPYFVAGDYDYMTIFDERYKITFPFTGSDFFRYAVHDANDRPLPREARRQVVEQYRARIDEVVSESRRFVRAPSNTDIAQPDTSIQGPSRPAS